MLVEEYLILKTMVKYGIGYEDAQKIIIDLQRKDLLEDYFTSLDRFKSITELKKYYEI